MQTSLTSNDVSSSLAPARNWKGHADIRSLWHACLAYSTSDSAQLVFLRLLWLPTTQILAKQNAESTKALMC